MLRGTRNFNSSNYALSQRRDFASPLQLNTGRAYGGGIFGGGLGLSNGLALRGGLNNSSSSNCSSSSRLGVFVGVNAANNLTTMGNASLQRPRLAPYTGNTAELTHLYNAWNIAQRDGLQRGVFNTPSWQRDESPRLLTNGIEIDRSIQQCTPLQLFGILVMVSGSPRFVAQFGQNSGSLELTMPITTTAMDIADGLQRFAITNSNIFVMYENQDITPMADHHDAINLYNGGAICLIVSEL